MRNFFIIQAVIILAALLPLLSAFGAGAVAHTLGCELHEGFVNPCIIGGFDIGSLLYSASVLGWLALITLPLGAVVWFIHVALGLWSLIVSRRVKRTA